MPKWNDLVVQPLACRHQTSHVSGSLKPGEAPDGAVTSTPSPAPTTDPRMSPSRAIGPRTAARAYDMSGSPRGVATPGTPGARADRRYLFHGGLLKHVPGAEEDRAHDPAQRHRGRGPPALSPRPDRRGTPVRASTDGRECPSRCGARVTVLERTSRCVARRRPAHRLVGQARPGLGVVPRPQPARPFQPAKHDRPRTVARCPVRGPTPGSLSPDGRRRLSHPCAAASVI